MVHDRECVRLERQPLAHAHVDGQRVVDVMGVRQRCGNERSDLLRRDLLAGRVDRREVGRRVAVAEVVLFDGEAAHTHFVIGSGANDPQKYDPNASRETLDAVPSEIFTVRIVSRPRRRELTFSTSPAITTSSSPPSAAIVTSGAAAS